MAPNFRRDERLRFASVLKPHWPTEQVYALARHAEGKAGVPRFIVRTHPFIERERWASGVVQCPCAPGRRKRTAEKGVSVGLLAVFERLRKAHGGGVARGYISRAHAGRSRRW